eukprot:7390034-Prymnesium_polylepis.1
MVDVLQHVLWYTSVALVSSSDSYGAGGARAFSNAAYDGGLNVKTTITFLKDSTDLTSQLTELRRSSSTVIVVYAQASDATRFVIAALDVGIGGGGYCWMVGDATVSDEMFWDYDSALRERALKGFFLVLPNAGSSWSGNSVNAKYYEKRQQLPPIINNETGQCSSETDDEGTYLWKQDHDRNASTPMQCADLWGSEEGLDTFGYDAVFAVAHALHELVEERKRTEVLGEELLDTLIRHVAFQGVTGPIDFFDASADPNRLYDGDRRAGFSYRVLNYVSNTVLWRAVGTWAPCAESTTCGWQERWTAYPHVGLTYSTDDNTRPAQSASCPTGEVLLVHIGMCGCANGYELNPSTAQCRLCEPGQDSRIPTVNHSGSDGCTICAPGYFRPLANLSADECRSCGSMRGVTCLSNSTIASLFVKPLYWRHSTETRV